MVKWSHSAKYDLKLIHDYIAHDSKIYAKRVIEQIITKSEQLELFPNSGKKVEEVDDPRIREIIIYSYRIIYEVEGENVEVLAIIHSKRDFSLTNKH